MANFLPQEYASLIDMTEGQIDIMGRPEAL
jgi:hypothetical protein